MVGQLRNRLTLLVVAVAAGACGHVPVSDALEATMAQAGANGRELGEALGHYSAPGDSLHAAAMHFLVANMAGKGTVAGPAVNEFYAFIDSVYTIRQPEYDIPAIYAQFRSGARYADAPLEKRLDAATLTASYLIDNVDRAMALRGKPWNSHLSFAEFCEYVLPYRVGSEEAQPWREVYAARFAPLVADTATALEAATAINDSLRRLPAHIALGGVFPVTMRPSTLFNIKFGVCGDYAALAAFAMRSVGIPVTLNFIPRWGRKNGSHAFNAVLDNDGRWHDFSGAEDNPDHHLNRFSSGITKIYRQAYGINPNSLAAVSHEPVPPLFRSPSMVDVTADFDAVPVADVTVEVPRNLHAEYVYLCVFSPMGWEPVAWACNSRGEARFADVGTDIVYQAATYTEGEIIPFGYPFLLGQSGDRKEFKSSGKRGDVILWRKNPVSESLKDYPASIVGGRFEGADNLGFRNATVLHVIADTPDFRYTPVVLPSVNREFRYLRYVSSDSTYGNMAEVEFLNPEGNALRGKVIGGYKPSIYYPRNGAEMLFDGDALTFFHTSDLGSWGGLELLAPAKVSAVRFLIRNDDNGIRRGHEYELFYASDGKWLSAGRQIAPADDEIKFTGIPAGALLWLHDHTGGREERIFEVTDNNKIIWH